MSNLNATEIAFAYRFDDFAHFAIAFQGNYGYAPAQYRSNVH